MTGDFVARIFKGKSVGSVIRVGDGGGENLAGGHAARLASAKPARRSKRAMRR